MSKKEMPVKNSDWFECCLKILGILGKGGKKQEKELAQIIEKNVDTTHKYIKFLKSMYPISSVSGPDGGVWLDTSCYNRFFVITENEKMRENKTEKNGKNKRKKENDGTNGTIIPDSMSSSDGQRHRVWRRRLYIIVLLIHHPYMYVGEIADYMGVSAKTINRDIDFLTKTFPIAELLSKNERYKKYYIIKEKYKENFRKNERETIKNMKFKK